MPLEARALAAILAPPLVLSRPAQGVVAGAEACAASVCSVEAAEALDAAVPGAAGASLVEQVAEEAEWLPEAAVPVQAPEAAARRARVAALPPRAAVPVPVEIPAAAAWVPVRAEDLEAAERWVAEPAWSPRAAAVPLQVVPQPLAWARAPVALQAAQTPVRPEPDPAAWALEVARQPAPRPRARRHAAGPTQCQIPAADSDARKVARGRPSPRRLPRRVPSWAEAPVLPTLERYNVSARAFIARPRSVWEGWTARAGPFPLAAKSGTIAA
jgi:hypothetical protein